MAYEWKSQLAESELVPEGALTSFIIYDAYGCVLGQA